MIKISFRSFAALNVLKKLAGVWIVEGKEIYYNQASQKKREYHSNKNMTSTFFTFPKCFYLLTSFYIHMNEKVHKKYLFLYT